MSRIRLFVAACCLSLLGSGGGALAASPSLVVSQVFAGGGNTGAPYANDFVELFNRGSAAVDVTGWSVQYAAASATSWAPTSLVGSVQPGRYYLVQLASSAAIGAALPTPDAGGTTNLAATGGKVAVTTSATPLACGASAGTCSAVPGVVDLVGYGPASDFEGAGSAPALSATTAALRGGGGCTDSDSNAADFSAGAPGPRNSSAAALACAGGPGAGATGAATARVSVQSVLALALEKTTLDFGQVVPSSTPAAIGERVTITSTSPAGYTLGVHRSPFTPSDLPLALTAVAPTGGTLGSALAGGSLVGIPIPPAADLVVGTTSAVSASGGDAWLTNVGFLSSVPAFPAGAYASTVTFSAVAR